WRRRIDWPQADVPEPSFTGARPVTAALEDLVPFIDWSPFFHAWEMRGRYPKILEDAVLGERAKELFADAQALLARIVEERLLTARGAYGFFRAAAKGDDVLLFADETRTKRLAAIHTLRQQAEKPAGEPLEALADFVAPEEAGRRDHLGLFAVTAGIG